MNGKNFAGNYTLRKIPLELWKKFKAKCALEGISIKDKIISLIIESLADKQSLK
tara:strand:+ start:1196 stop:1357 length:162 start_codon:yes stop_codon:yes gene_type:complete